MIFIQVLLALLTYKAMEGIARRVKSNHKIFSLVTTLNLILKRYDYMLSWEREYKVLWRKSKQRTDYSKPYSPENDIQGNTYESAIIFYNKKVSLEDRLKQERKRKELFDEMIVNHERWKKEKEDYKQFKRSA